MQERSGSRKDASAGTSSSNGSVPESRKRGKASDSTNASSCARASTSRAARSDGATMNDRVAGKSTSPRSGAIQIPASVAASISTTRAEAASKRSRLVMAKISRCRGARSTIASTISLSLCFSNGPAIAASALIAE